MESRNITIFTFLVIFGIGFFELSNAQVVGYGDKCNDSLVCNKWKHFNCNAGAGVEGICICKTNMLYHAMRDECVVKEGGQCFELVSDGTLPTNCTDNAACDQAVENVPGTCNCCSSCIATSNKECKLGHNSTLPCSYNKDCNVASFLECRDSRCLCDQGELAIWTGKTCESLLGGQCSVSNPINLDTDRLCAGSPKTNCTDAKICECATGFVQQDGQCRVPYNAACTTDDDCVNNVSCLPSDPNVPETKICTCQTSTEEYDSETSSCLRLAGQACNSTSQHCIKHSTCSNSSVCECDDNYSKTKDQHCRANLGTVCTTESPCNAELYLRCNEGTCACEENYSDDGGKCVGNYGAGCSADSDCKSSLCSGTEGSKTCDCPSGSSAVAGICLYNYNKPCDNEKQCNPDNFLSCGAESVCDCSDFSKYIYQEVQSTDRCSVKVDQACTGPSDSTCVQNAACSSNVCKCLGGFAPDKDGQCVEGKSGATASVVTSPISLTLIIMASVTMFSKAY